MEERLNYAIEKFLSKNDGNLTGREEPLKITIFGHEVYVESVWLDKEEQNYFIHVNSPEFEGDLRVTSMTRSVQDILFEYFSPSTKRKRLRRTIKVEVEIEFEYDPNHFNLVGMGENYVDAIAKDMAIRPTKSIEDGVKLLRVCNRDEDAWWLIGNRNEEVSTDIVDGYWIDNGTYVVICDDYIQESTDGTMGELHLEVEYWEDEKSFHFIIVANGSEALEPSQEELPQEKRDQLICRIKEMIHF